MKFHTWPITICSCGEHLNEQPHWHPGMNPATVEVVSLDGIRALIEDDDFYYMLSDEVGNKTAHRVQQRLLKEFDNAR
jgi:hypothetical protein